MNDFKSLVGMYEKDSQGRPTWDLYFMTLALVVAQRSLDPATKHGTIVASDDHTILSVGYNSPPRNCVDHDIPTERPAKYSWYVHSEIAAIANAAREGIRLKDSVFYITGHPCDQCMRAMLNVGVKRILYGPIGSHCVSHETQTVIQDMLSKHIENIEFDHFKNVGDIKSLLAKTGSYLENKMTENKGQYP